MKLCSDQRVRIPDRDTNVCRLQQLREDPMHGDAKALKGKPKRYRSRVGDYRIIYTFTAVELRIIRVAHRSEAYK